MFGTHTNLKNEVSKPSCDLVAKRVSQSVPSPNEEFGLHKLAKVNDKEEN